METETNTKHTRQPTFRQMKAVEIWVRCGCKSKARAILEAGYSKSIARKPHKVFGSLTVKRELEKQGIIKEKVQDDGIKAVMIEPVDFSKITSQQLDWLKVQLAKLPDTPRQSDQLEGAIKIKSYTPKGSGVDIFNNLSVEKNHNYPKSLSFSSI